MCDAVQCSGAIKAFEIMCLSVLYKFIFINVISTYLLNNRAVVILCFSQHSDVQQTNAHHHLSLLCVSNKKQIHTNRILFLKSIFTKPLATVVLTDVAEI